MLLLALAGEVAPRQGLQGQEAPDLRRDGFDDPLVRATDGLPDCPRQQPRRLTPDEMRDEAHSRAERGGDCYRAGRCRLPNSYLYDREIVPRLVQALRADGGFDDASIWVEGRRRWVWLKGCVRKPEQAAAAERIARGTQDVEQVINELTLIATRSGC